jgi:tetratricopeptide (TPR) repeat protein
MIIPDSYASIAAVYYDQGDYEASMREYRRSLEYLNSNFGEHHIFSCKILTGIGKVHYSQGNYREAVVQFKEAIRILENGNRTTRIDSAGPLSNLGLAYGELGDYESSLRMHARALETKGGHKESGEVKMNMAITFMHQGKLNKAIALLQDALRVQETGYGVDHLKTADTLMYLGLALQRQKQADAGEIYLTRCLRIHDKSFRPDHPRTLRAKALMDGNVKSLDREQPTSFPEEEQTWCLLP